MTKNSKSLQANWTWLPASATGGAGGAAYAKLFRNEALPMSELLAREVLQNSWDAAQRHDNPDAPPFRFKFRFAELSGKTKAEFIKALDLEALKERREKIQEGREFPDLKHLESLLDPELRLRVLYLEDFATYGMFGDPKDTLNSHLYRALYILGSTKKDSASASQGGSFGFGKSAFIGSSSVRTAVVHTRFQRSDEDHTDQRVVGFTWWGEHEVEGSAFEGRAMFGAPANESHAGALPLEGEVAEEFAKKLGMVVRSADPASWGSTVMLLDPVVGPEEVCSAIETYWWPAIEEHLMDVTVELPDGSVVTPRPRARRDLYPFIRAFGIATGLKEPSVEANEKLASQRWRARGGYNPGSLALLLATDSVSPNQMLTSTIGELDRPLVALIREPRMVIQYKEYRSRLPIRGVFVADPEIDQNLRDVEPPSHNTWESNAGSDVNSDSRSIAKRVMNSISREVKDFAQEFAPPPAVISAELPLFGEVLGRFLSGRSPGPGVAPPKSTDEKTSLIFRSAGPDRRERIGVNRIKLSRK
jgi:hypothetical protein